MTFSTGEYFRCSKWKNKADFHFDFSQYMKIPTEFSKIKVNKIFQTKTDYMVIHYCSNRKDMFVNFQAT